MGQSSRGINASGPQSYWAAKLLGWENIEAVVREDLGSAESDFAVEHFLSDNMNRRQMDNLDVARCYQKLKRMGQPDVKYRRLRDILAEKLAVNMSGRNLDRLENLLKLPRFLQDMISRKELAQDHGAKILKLPREKRDEFYSAVEEGVPLKVALMDFGIIPEKGRPKTRVEMLNDAFDQAAKSIANINKYADDLAQAAPSRMSVKQFIDSTRKSLRRWQECLSDAEPQDEKSQPATNE